ncbi:MAG: RecQ family ATP-dependent DNA helicase [Spirochaetaceae bacterium]|jgi:ATP-dependent DNA helicase RecQ|nr:RecQ family ATP-dependent DNA helicase [Spirochaetaceae bacterium]
MDGDEDGTLWFPSGRETEGGEAGGEDPLSRAVTELFGLSYLFPYQRLVVANILEAAEAAGIPLRWNGAQEALPLPALPLPALPLPALPLPETGPAHDTDRGGKGRQIVILPTGAGKSLCFQLPAMLLDGVTLVLYPILSLMADQERRLRERGFSPVLLRGGQSREEREVIWQKIRSGESRFIISNPETLLTPAVLEKLPRLGIAHVVIDEAHCVSEWGESFRPAYLEIGNIIRAAKTSAGTEPLVTAFTATASAPVLEKIERYIFSGGEKAHRIVGNPGRVNIRYAALGCLVKDAAVRDCISGGGPGINARSQTLRPAIVFCSSRAGTEKLSRYLRGALDDRAIRFYHAGLSREEKEAVEGWFFESDNGVLVSTCAYGMGVDKSNIRTVIHRDCPPSVEAYLQESGRAGRDGEASSAILLWGPEDGAEMARAKTPLDRARLESLLRYARNVGRCRREALLGLLDYEGEGETAETRCCDVCSGTARGLYREEEALIAFFRRNRRRFTLIEAAETLARDGRWSAAESRRALRALIREGKLRELAGPFWQKKLTP